MDEKCTRCSQPATGRVISRQKTAIVKVCDQCKAKMIKTGCWESIK